MTDKYQTGWNTPRVIPLPLLVSVVGVVLFTCFSLKISYAILVIDSDVAQCYDCDLTLNHPAVSHSHVPKFFVIPIPETTDWLLGNFTQDAKVFYDETLNEEQAEIWLHRALLHGFQNNSSWTDNITEANVVLIPSYLHLNARLRRRMKKQLAYPLHKSEIAEMMLKKILQHDKNKPHVLLVPTWNPVVSRSIGVASIMKLLNSFNVNIFSVGFELNSYWQHLAVDRIIPIPYVVKTNFTRHELVDNFEQPRQENFVFYAGDERKHASSWSGCNRSMLLPLSNRSDMFVRVVNKDNRINPEEYQHKLMQSDYCLIVCGDTPTSRSLASAMLLGCIPIRIGSRLRGFCGPPCHKGWGWDITNRTHLPFSNAIDWSIFPEVREAEFIADPAATLQSRVFSKLTREAKEKIRDEMKRMQMAWMYGTGDPVSSYDFGDTTVHILDSITHHVRNEHLRKNRRV